MSLLTVVIILLVISVLLWFFADSETIKKIATVVGIISFILSIYFWIIERPPCAYSMCILKKHEGGDTWLIEGDGTKEHSVGDELVVYAETIPNVEIPIAKLHVVALNPDTLVGQELLIHPNFEIDTRLRVDDNVAQLSISELIPVSHSLGYLLEPGKVRLVAPESSIVLEEGTILEAFEPQLIGQTIADYASFDPPIKMRITQIGTEQIIAQVELITNSEWPINGTIVNYVRTEIPNLYNNIYRMLARQLALGNDCPQDLENEDWIDFKDFLVQNEFRDLESPYREDVEAYRTFFINALTPPLPEPDSGGCGVIAGQLSVLANPILVDFEITGERALEDDQSQELADGIDEFLLAIARVTFHISINLDPSALNALPMEERLYIEYLLIYNEILAKNERDSESLRAQVALLSLNPNEIQDEATREDFIALHERMLILSAAITNGEPNIIGQRSSEVALTIIELPCKIDLDPEIGREIGGESLVDLLKSIIDSSTLCSSELTTPDSNSTPISTFISDEEQAYIEWLDNTARKMSDSDARFVGLMEDLADDPSLSTDSDWQLSLAQEFTIWQSIYDEAQLKIPPPSLEEVHALIVEGLEKYNTYATLLINPPEGADPATINEHIRAARELISQGSTLYQQWRNEHGQ